MKHAIVVGFVVAILFSGAPAVGLGLATAAGLLVWLAKR